MKESGIRNAIRQKKRERNEHAIKWDKLNPARLFNQKNHLAGKPAFDRNKLIAYLQQFWKFTEGSRGGYFSGSHIMLLKKGSEKRHLMAMGKWVRKVRGMDGIFWMRAGKREWIVACLRASMADSILGSRHHNFLSPFSSRKK